MRVSIPAVRLSILRGENEMEQKTSLEKRREILEDLDLASEELDAEARVERKRLALERARSGNDEPPRAPEDTLSKKIVETVVLPIVQERLQGDPRGRSEEGVTAAALKLATEALKKGGGQPPTSTVSQASEVITLIKEVRGLTGDDSEVTKKLDTMQKTIEELQKAKDPESPLAEFDRVISLVNKVKETYSMGSGDGEATKLQTEHDRWKFEQERLEKTRDRAWTLRLRQIDKQHDLELAKLGVERERTELLDKGLKRLGATITEALVDDEGFEETSPKGPQGTEIIQIPCPECEVVLNIPPEGQVLGATVSCPKCNSIFETFQEE